MPTAGCDGAQVGILVGEAIGRGLRLDGVLPAEDVERRHVGELLLAQIGEDIRLDELLLAALGGDAHLLGDVPLAELVEGVEGHVRLPSIWRRKSTSQAIAAFLV